MIVDKCTSSNTTERKTGHLYIEMVAILEDNRERLETEVDNSKDERNPQIQEQSHSIEQDELCKSWAPRSTHEKE